VMATMRSSGPSEKIRNFAEVGAAKMETFSRLDDEDCVGDGFGQDSHRFTAGDRCEHVPNLCSSDGALILMYTTPHI